MIYIYIYCDSCFWWYILIQKESTNARSKKENDDFEERNQDEKLEVVHGEPKYHWGEWEVEEASTSSSQRESDPLIWASKEVLPTK